MNENTAMCILGVACFVCLTIIVIVGIKNKKS